MKALPAVLLAVFLCAGASRAQSDPEVAPETGSTELEVWTGGGVGTSGITAGNGIWNAGARYG